MTSFFRFVFILFLFLISVFKQQKIQNDWWPSPVDVVEHPFFIYFQFFNFLFFLHNSLFVRNKKKILRKKKYLHADFIIIL